MAPRLLARPAGVAGRQPGCQPSPPPVPGLQPAVPRRRIAYAPGHPTVSVRLAVARYISPRPRNSKTHRGFRRADRTRLLSGPVSTTCRPSSAIDTYQRARQRDRQRRCHPGRMPSWPSGRADGSGRTREKPLWRIRCRPPYRPRISAVTCGYHRTSSPVTALPMITRWISEVPSKMVKLVDVQAVSAGRWPAGRPLASTNSAPRCGPRVPRSWHGRRPLPHQLLRDARRRSCPARSAPGRDGDRGRLAGNPSRPALGPRRAWSPRPPTDEIGALLARYHATAEQIRMPGQRPSALPPAEAPAVLLSALDSAGIDAHHSAVIRQHAQRLARRAQCSRA
jgi:hypothetical protein